MRDGRRREERGRHAGHLWTTAESCPCSPRGLAARPTHVPAGGGCLRCGQQAGMEHADTDTHAHACTQETSAWSGACAPHEHLGAPCFRGSVGEGHKASIHT